MQVSEILGVKISHVENKLPQSSAGSQFSKRNISHHGWVTKLDRESAVSRCCHLPCHRQHTDTDHPKSQRQA